MAKPPTQKMAMTATRTFVSSRLGMSPRLTTGPGAAEVHIRSSVSARSSAVAVTTSSRSRVSRCASPSACMSRGSAMARTPSPFFTAVTTTPSDRATSSGRRRAASRSTGSTRRGELMRDSVGSIGATISGYGASETSGVPLTRARTSASSSWFTKPSRKSAEAIDSSDPLRATTASACSWPRARLPRRSSSTLRHSGRTSLRRRRTVSAAAAAWTARRSSSGGASFCTYVVAPAARARSRELGSTVRKTVPMSGRSRASVRVTSRPDRPGIWLSRTTRSGFKLPARARALGPSTASPTTAIAGSPARILRTPSRTSRWSSAMRTRSTARLTPSPGRSVGAAAVCQVTRSGEYWYESAGWKRKLSPSRGRPRPPSRRRPRGTRTGRSGTCGRATRGSRRAPARNSAGG